MLFLFQLFFYFTKRKNIQFDTFYNNGYAHQHSTSFLFENSIFSIHTELTFNFDEEFNNFSFMLINIPAILAVKGFYQLLATT